MADRTTRYDLETKIKVLDSVDSMTEEEISNEYGMTKRTIQHWKKGEDKLRDRWQRQQIEKKSNALDGELGAVAEYEKQYLERLQNLGELEDRKKVFVGALEKVMWDHLSALDEQRYEDIKVDARVRMIKDMNEIREKLSGEPSVIMEYRNKFQMNVMMVVREMIPERAEEFLERIKMVEDVA